MKVVFIVITSITLFLSSCSNDMACEDPSIICFECVVPGPTSNSVFEECIGQGTLGSEGNTEEDLIQMMDQHILDGGSCLASYDYQ